MSMYFFRLEAVYISKPKLLHECVHTLGCVYVSMFVNVGTCM